MSHFLQHYTLKFTPLSPIHIGTGESYEPTNYVIDECTLYEFDTGGALVALSKADRAELSKTVSGKPNTQMLKAVQKFFFDRREDLIPWAVNAVPVLDGVAIFYGDRVGQIANVERNGHENINKLEIDRCAYNPINRHPVVFGSSVKGAIRTALLNHINKEQSLPQITDRRSGKTRKEDNAELQQRLFDFRPGKFELDPMRLIQVGDAAWNDQDDLPRSQICMSVNRKKIRVLDENGELRSSQAESNGNLNKLLECISPWRYRAFSAQLNLQLIDGITTSKAPETHLRWSVEEIAKICSSFYLPKLKAELREMRDRGFIDNEWDKNIQNLLTSISDKILKGQVFLLRVGRHSGAESITFNGKGVRNIKILEGKDPDTQKQRFSFSDKTKTWWLAAQHREQQTELLPFGWLLVEVESNDAPQGDWHELAELCTSQQQKHLLWVEKQAQQKLVMEGKRREAEQRRNQEELERLRELELIKQTEQQHLAKQHAEQQRLANLSPIEQEIEAFLKLIQVAEHDTRLLQELEKGRWQNEDAKIVAQKIKVLMEQAGKWLPDFTGDNKQKVKLKERSQKVLNYLKD